MDVTWMGPDPATGRYTGYLRRDHAGANHCSANAQGLVPCCPRCGSPLLDGRCRYVDCPGRREPPRGGADAWGLRWPPLGYVPISMTDARRAR